MLTLVSNLLGKPTFTKVLVSSIWLQMLGLSALAIIDAPYSNVMVDEEEIDRIHVQFTGAKRIEAVAAVPVQFPPIEVPREYEEVVHADAEVSVEVARTLPEAELPPRISVDEPRVSRVAAAKQPLNRATSRFLQERESQTKSVARQPLTSEIAFNPAVTQTPEPAATSQPSTMPPRLNLSKVAAENGMAQRSQSAKPSGSSDSAPTHQVTRTTNKRDEFKQVHENRATSRFLQERESQTKSAARQPLTTEIAFNPAVTQTPEPAATSQPSTTPPRLNLSKVAAENGMAHRSQSAKPSGSSDSAPTHRVTRTTNKLNEFKQVHESPSAHAQPERPKRVVELRPSVTAVAIPQLAGTDNTEPPSLLRNQPPAYPLEAYRAGLEGNVLLEIHVTSLGRVEKVRVSRSSGHSILDDAALDAVRKWQGTPAYRNGRAVATIEYLPVYFQLRPSAQ